MAEERGVTKRFQQVCPCAACEKARGVKEPKKLRVQQYSAEPPNGWQAHKTTGELVTEMRGGPATWVMGVELETQLPELYSEAQRQRFIATLPVHPAFTGNRYADNSFSSDYSNEFRVWQRESDDNYLLRDRLYMEWEDSLRAKATNLFDSQEAAGALAPDDFWVPKHDGSVTGPEFASQPASLAYWYSIRPELEMMFSTLLHAGVRSHVGDRAGMHINISLNAFSDSDHLARFATLINMHAPWVKRMSQRTQRSLDQWATVGGGTFSTQYRIDRWAQDVMYYGNGGTNRYVALNSPGGGRLEFRAPRGTLRIDRFFARLEWVHSMVEFTRSYGDTSAIGYMRWVMSGTDYPDLRAFIMEKFSMNPEPTPYIPAPAVPSGNAVMPSASVLASAAAHGDPYVDPDDSYEDGDCPCGDGCYEGECESCMSSSPDAVVSMGQRPPDIVFMTLPNFTITTGE